jgi:hypothetical protein
LPTLSKIGTRRFQRFVVDHFPWKSLQEFAKIIDVMHETAVEVYETKRKALEEGDEVVERQLAKGKDIMSILSACLFFKRFFGFCNAYTCSAR